MSEPQVRLSNYDEEIAMEKGRLIAALNMARDPEARKRTEEKFGTEFCRQRWPEVFDPSPFKMRIVDKIHFLGLGGERVD